MAFGNFSRDSLNDSLFIVTLCLTIAWMQLDVLHGIRTISLDNNSVIFLLSGAHFVFNREATS